MKQPFMPMKLLESAAGIFPFWVWIALVGLFGLAAGIGIYTFSYAQGLSYMSNDPKACLNCHVMRDVYEGWNHGSHKAVATCNDCHIPHSLIPKYIAKGLNGWNHSSAFTTGNFPEPIRIKKFNRNVLEHNCINCHGEMVDLISHKDTNEPTDCLKCHSDVGHSH